MKGLEVARKEWRKVAADAYQSFKATQFPQELGFYLDLMASRKVNRVLELGLGSGGTLYGHIKLVGRGGLVVGVDRREKLRYGEQLAEIARVDGVELRILLGRNTMDPPDGARRPHGPLRTEASIPSSSTAIMPSCP